MVGSSLLPPPGKIPRMCRDMKSMTGFGRGEARSEEYRLTIELSGVNRKQAELALNMPRVLVEFEPAVRQAILDRVSRGRVNVSVTMERLSGSFEALKLDEEKVRSYAALFRDLARLSGFSDMQPAVSDFMRVNDILVSGGQPEAEPGEWQPLLTEALEQALDEFLAMRGREGDHIKADLLERLDRIEDAVNEMKAYAPQVVVRFRESLHRRLNEAGIPLDLNDERLVRELGIFAERCDVAEEFTRLASHFGQFRLKCALDEAVGRPLDFLCQEIFREFNTIGSKANDASLAHFVVASKTELEKIREQVQNIE